MTNAEGRTTGLEWLTEHEGGELSVGAGPRYSLMMKFT